MLVKWPPCFEPHVLSGWMCTTKKQHVRFVTLLYVQQFVWVKLIEAEWRIYASLNRAIIGSDNGLSPVRRQAIIWTNVGILLIGPLGTNFCEILIGIQTFSFKKLHLKTSSAKWRLFCFGLNELKTLAISSIAASTACPPTVGSTQ